MNSRAVPPLTTISFDLEMTVLSSIVHRGDASDFGSDTLTLFRREMVVTESGELQPIPIISGSQLRGVLRRMSEALTASILDYEQTLPTAAAHLLTNGGRLAKSARPLTDEQERELKRLIPHLALFGGAASARIMSGLLEVGKVLPEVAELAHLLGDRPSGRPLLPAVLLMGTEQFTHLSDVRLDARTAPLASTGDDSPQQRVGVEVIPAGARLHSSIRLVHATSLQVAYFQAVLEEFVQHGYLGGRRAAGHGRIATSIETTVVRGALPDGLDWVAALAGQRDAAIAALADLT